MVSGIPDTQTGLQLTGRASHAPTSPEYIKFFKLVERIGKLRSRVLCHDVSDSEVQ